MEIPTKAYSLSYQLLTVYMQFCSAGQGPEMDQIEGNGSLALDKLVLVNQGMEVELNYHCFVESPDASKRIRNFGRS